MKDTIQNLKVEQVIPISTAMKEHAALALLKQIAFPLHVLVTAAAIYCTFLWHRNFGIVNLVTLFWGSLSLTRLKYLSAPWLRRLPLIEHFNNFSYMDATPGVKLRPS